MKSKKDIGNIGEELAIKYLNNKNYLILNKNYYIKGGEIDVIAQDKESQEIVFMEVKTRTSREYGWPEESINATKRHRLAKTANRYLAHHHYPFDQNYRFDSLAIELDFKTRLAKIRHFKYI